MSARSVALEGLRRCRRDSAWSDAVLDGLIRADGLDRRDAALATRLCYGVQQNAALLDFYLSHWCSHPVEKLDPAVLDVLRLSAYQLLFLDRIPPSAVVNEAVALTKASGRAQAGRLVNAVLRRLAEHRAALPEVPGAGTPEYLATRWSHPLWLARRLTEQEGYAETAAFFASNNAPAPVTLQVNTLRTDTAALAAALEREGFAPEAHPWLPDCLTLDGAGGLAESRAFRDGWFYIQDAAAALSVFAANPKPGMRVLDACAAPGGKSFAAARAMESRGEVLACDLHEKKLSRLKKGAERLGFAAIHTRAMDARRPDKELLESFDLVLADVPCSGLGVIRKKPDIREKDPAALAALPEIQLAILLGLADCVRPGGALLYSTCTVLQEENAAVVEAFLCRRSDFSPETPSLPFASEASGELGVQLWPQRQGTDGFYFCKLRRTS